MFLFLEGRLVQVKDTDEENIAEWLAYTQRQPEVNSVGINQYLLARSGATGDLLAAVDAMVLAKLQAIQPPTHKAKTVYGARADQITRNWLRQFADNLQVPAPVRTQARQLLADWPK